MSLYRQTGEARRRRRRNIALGAVGVLLIVVAIVLAATSGGGTSAADRAKDANAAVMRAQDGLELLSTEYGQAVRGGRVVAPTEYAAAKADVARAEEALDGQRSELAARDAAALRRADAALAAVAAAVGRRVAPAALEREIAAARAALRPLAR